MPQVREIEVKRARSRLHPKLISRLTKRKKKGGARLLPNRSKLIKTLDSLYSTYVRNFYAQNGIVKCYTCPYTCGVKEIQCGHYISRYFKNTRWLLDDLRPQCFMCNMRLGGCAHIFREKLVAELGEARVVEMEHLAKEDFTHDDDWLVIEILKANKLCITAAYSLPVSTASNLSRIIRVAETAKSLSITPTKVTVASMPIVVSSMA